MTLLKPMFILAVLLLMDRDDVSLRVQLAVPPVRPVHTIAAGLVVAEVGLDQATGALQTRVLHGDAPFVPPAFYTTTMGTVAVRPWTPDEDYPALPQRVIDPGYPAASLSTGSVILEVQVNEAGVVTGIDAITGIPGLTEQAKAAVKKWQFSPAVISGKVAPSTAFVVVSFVLPA